MTEQFTKRIAYYIVALVSFFFLSWAATDILSAGVNLATIASGATQMDDSPPGVVSPQEMASPAPGYNEIYRQMVMDRVVDSGARLIVSGVIFILARKRIRELRGA